MLFVTQQSITIWRGKNLRMDSLEIILSLGNRENLSKEEKFAMADRKNVRYVEMISKMEHDKILPGVEDLLKELREKDIKIALGSVN